MIHLWHLVLIVQEIVKLIAAVIAVKGVVDQTEAIITMDKSVEIVKEEQQVEPVLMHVGVVLLALDAVVAQVLVKVVPVNVLDALVLAEVIALELVLVDALILAKVNVLQVVKALVKNTA